MDFDGDGLQDFITGSAVGKVYLFRRKPNKAFFQGEEVRAQSGTDTTLSAICVKGPSAVAMANWYGSDKPDLFVGTGAGDVRVYPNCGSRDKPVFAAGQRMRAAGESIEVGGGNAAPFVADWDQDGKLDLIIGCGNGQVIWHRNIGTTNCPELAGEVTLVDRSARNEFEDPKRSGANAKVSIFDWNSDGLLDLIVGDDNTGQGSRGLLKHGWVWVYLQKPTGDLSKRARH